MPLHYSAMLQPKTLSSFLKRANGTTWRVVTVFLVLVSAFAATIILASRSPIDETTADSESPPVALWAWERPEMLGFIDPDEAEAAVLVGTLNLTSDSVNPHPRQQPLELPRAARRTAVVRIESDRPRLTPAQRRQAVAAILTWTQTSPAYAAVQIDFDATVSQRPFYRRLLEDLRHELPAAVPISITALASWCLGDRWFEDLPIDEAVPMLFRMGIDEDAIRAALAHGDDFRDPRCQTSYGLATDEPLPPMRPGRRLYLFHPEAWTEAAYGSFRHRLREAPL